MKWPLHNDLVEKGHIVVIPDFCNPDGGMSSVKPPVYSTEPTAAEALNRFLMWVNRHYIANHYMLILFGHGNLVAGNTFLADSTPPSYLKLSEFANAIKEFKHKIDVLACDNCVMNGIETAVQLSEYVGYMLGSQDLMLANAWPVCKMIEEVRQAIKKAAKVTPKEIALKVLRVSVLNLLDFTLMDRSLEQAVCDVTKITPESDLVKAVKGLSTELQYGLQFTQDKPPVLRYPVIADLVRLARLEAQAYWSETFVDLFDFAALLVKKCDEFENTIKDQDGVITVIQDIHEWSATITDIFRSDTDKIVPRAFYVGPHLQYSHGISIFFPWTLPEGPITFEPIRRSYDEPKDYKLKTPFEEYKTYLFAQEQYGDWARFLIAFFKATLRNVRLVEHPYEDDPARSEKFLDEERVTAGIDLQKSSSSTGEEDTCPRIKNYPRRYYLSPADCTRKAKEGAIEPQGTVSYLGWNIRGLVAEVVDLPAQMPKAQASLPPLPSTKPTA